MKWYESKRGLVAALVFLALGMLLLAGCAAEKAAPSSVAKGGRLYDKWWKEVSGAVEPKDNQPLWALQSTNKRSGSETWRCKECHGWDYKGKDGAYGAGSHATGFVGVFDAGIKKSKDELKSILKGKTNPKHDFSSLMKETDLTDLVNFLKEGQIDVSAYVDYSTKKPKSARMERGNELREKTCVSCHGADGKTINFGSEKEPEYVGTIASSNPQEFIHKLRHGQPGVIDMSSALERNWTTQDVMDLLGHAQTLPQK